MSTPSGPLAVIGSGILGLTSARLLQQTYPHTPISIITAELPSPDPSTLSIDYTSAWAGAHYRPIPAGASLQLQIEARLGKRTYKIRKEEFAEHGEETTGIRFLEGVEYLEKPSEAALGLKTGDEYAGEVDGFRLFETKELPKGVVWGCRYWTYDVNPDIYCSWLLGNFIKNGGKILVQRLASVDEAFGVVPGAKTVVNCSGRGFGDEKVFITRGQTVLVKNECKRTVTRQNSDGSWTALIPRPGTGTIIGVSKEVGDWHTEARRETREAMLEKARRLLPGEILKEGEEWDVLRDVVGRRPTREGGLKLEVEDVKGGKRVVHAYGVGGRGYELSWGIAGEVVRMVRGEGSEIERLEKL